jgi:N-carbamoylputrescine amidase
VVLLPELAASGYSLSEQIWEYAEPFEGRTVAFLRALAMRHGVYVGGGFVEVEGEDFYNSFALATPDGDVRGPVRKVALPDAEARLFRSGSTTPVLDTAIGRVGVGISSDNLLYERLRQFYCSDVDMVLMPAAVRRGLPPLPGAATHLVRALGGVAHFYARALGVPVVMAGRVGRLETALPAANGDSPEELRTTFSGMSTVINSDGSVLGALGEGQEGVVQGEVRLAPVHVASTEHRRYGPWAVPMPWASRLWPSLNRQAGRTYVKNPRRAAAARTAAGSLN